MIDAMNKIAAVVEEWKSGKLTAQQAHYKIDGITVELWKQGLWRGNHG